MCEKSKLPVYFSLIGNVSNSEGRDLIKAMRSMNTETYARVAALFSPPYFFLNLLKSSRISSAGVSGTTAGNFSKFPYRILSPPA